MNFIMNPNASMPISDSGKFKRNFSAKFSLKATQSTNSASSSKWHLGSERILETPTKGSRCPKFRQGVALKKLSPNKNRLSQTLETESTAQVIKYERFHCLNPAPTDIWFDDEDCRLPNIPHQIQNRKTLSSLTEVRRELQLPTEKYSNGVPLDTKQLQFQPSITKPSNMLGRDFCTTTIRKHKPALVFIPSHHGDDGEEHKLAHFSSHSQLVSNLQKLQSPGQPSLRLLVSPENQLRSGRKLLGSRQKFTFVSGGSSNVTFEKGLTASGRSPMGQSSSFRKIKRNNSRGEGVTPREDHQIEPSLKQSTVSSMSEQTFHLKVVPVLDLTLTPELEWMSESSASGLEVEPMLDSNPDLQQLLGHNQGFMQFVTCGLEHPSGRPPPAESTPKSLVWAKGRFQHLEG